MPSYVFRQTILCLLEAIQTREIYGCIYDLTKLKSVPQQEQDWLLEEVLPLLSKSSLRKVAFLESFNRMGHLDLTDLVYSSVPAINFEFQYFEDADSALDWLGQDKRMASSYEYASRGRALPMA